MKACTGLKIFFYLFISDKETAEKMRDILNALKASVDLVELLSSLCHFFLIRFIFRAALSDSRLYSFR